MKKQISFDDELLVKIIQKGVYRKDDGDGDEYVEGEYLFEIDMESHVSSDKNNGDPEKPTITGIQWIGKVPFRHMIEQEQIEKKIIKKYSKKFLSNE